jgi:hypothetical protein
MIGALSLAACGSDSKSGATAGTSTASSAADTTIAEGGGVASTDETTNVTDPPATPPPSTEPTKDPPTTTQPATTTTVAAPKGWIIHDTVTAKQSGGIMNYDAVSCGPDGQYGPWHIVVTFTVDGNLTQDVFFDTTLGADGTGSLTGQELSTWSDGLSVSGIATGTATLTPVATVDTTYLLTLGYDETVTFTQPPLPADVETNRHDFDLDVVPSTTECP